MLKKLTIAAVSQLTALLAVVPLTGCNDNRKSTKDVETVTVATAETQQSAADTAAAAEASLADNADTLPESTNTHYTVSDGMTTFTPGDDFDCFHYSYLRYERKKILNAYVNNEQYYGDADVYCAFKLAENILTLLGNDSGGYYLKPAEYKITYHPYYADDEACGSGSTVDINAASGRYLFLGFNDHNMGKIIPAALRRIVDGEIVEDSGSRAFRYIVPNENLTFEYDGKEYLIEVSVEITDKPTEHGENEILRVVYSRKGSEAKQELLGGYRGRYMFLAIEFVGDIDGDGLPDIIFTRRENIMVFLSSSAESGDYLNHEVQRYRSWDGC